MDSISAPRCTSAITAGWAAQLAASAEPVLVVLGLDGAPSELERILTTDFQPLFGDGSNCTVLLSCTGTAAPTQDGRAAGPTLVFDDRVSHARPEATA